MAAVLAAAAIAVAVTSLPGSLSKSLTTVFKTGWTLAAGAFLVPLLATLYDPQPSPTAVKAAAIAGALAALFFGAAQIAGITAISSLIKVKFTATIAASAATYLATRIACRTQHGNT